MHDSDFNEQHTDFVEKQKPTNFVFLKQDFFFTSENILFLGEKVKFLLQNFFFPPEEKKKPKDKSKKKLSVIQTRSFSQFVTSEILVTHWEGKKHFPQGNKKYIYICFRRIFFISGTFHIWNVFHLI